VRKRLRTPGSAPRDLMMDVAVAVQAMIDFRSSTDVRGEVFLVGDEQDVLARQGSPRTGIREVPARSHSAFTSAVVLT